MTHAFICDAIRTPFGRYAGALSSLRTDDLGATPMRALMARNRNLDWELLDDVIYGCANQAGEDNRNVARMSSLLAGLPLNGWLGHAYGAAGVALAFSVMVATKNLASYLLARRLLQGFKKTEPRLLGLETNGVAT